MREKITAAKNYVFERKGAFMIGGVVVFVYSSIVVASYLNVVNTREQFKIIDMINNWEEN